jgi:hypothetical protein
VNIIKVYNIYKRKRRVTRQGKDIEPENMAERNKSNRYRVAEKKDSTLLRPRKGLGFPDRR